MKAEQHGYNYSQMDVAWVKQDGCRKTDGWNQILEKNIKKIKWIKPPDYEDFT